MLKREHLHRTAQISAHAAGLLMSSASGRARSDSQMSTTIGPPDENTRPACDDADGWVDLLAEDIKRARGDERTKQRPFVAQEEGLDCGATLNAEPAAAERVRRLRARRIRIARRVHTAEHRRVGGLEDLSHRFLSLCSALFLPSLSA